jgi:hypothetical protein
LFEAFQHEAFQGDWIGEVVGLSETRSNISIQMQHAARGDKHRLWLHGADRIGEQRQLRARKYQVDFEVGLGPGIRITEVGAEASQAHARPT